VFAACASYAKIIEKFKSHFEGNSATAARMHARMGERTHANKHTQTPTHIAPFLSRVSGLQCSVSRWAAAHAPPWLNTWRNATQSRMTGVAATRRGTRGLGAEGRAVMQPGAALSAILLRQARASRAFGACGWSAATIRAKCAHSAAASYSPSGLGTRRLAPRHEARGCSGVRHSRPAGRSHGRAGIPLMQM
jgi:hypothetical protein